jgi:saccharopine dehydrogenase (NADP+, L-glutamate forming)
MSKHILLFGSGKSSIYLIEFLRRECVVNDWLLTIADSNPAGLDSMQPHMERVTGIRLDVSNDSARRRLVNTADVVISLLPPLLHYLVATDCLEYGKHLLTASYIDKQVGALAREVKDRGILFLFEMGLDPGIDHMSAMRLIKKINQPGVRITSFRSHCGGLVAPESDDNPMHYKISWNPRNVLMAGSKGASFRQGGNLLQVSYEHLFDNCREIFIDETGELVFYPNRDSLTYMNMYGLENAETFIRTTLRHPAFCTAWSSIVKAGLTSDQQIVPHQPITFRQWSEPILPYVTAETREQYRFLGFFDDTPVPPMLRTSPDILLHLMETKMMMKPGDKDMVVMVHEVEFVEAGKNRKTASSLVLKGEDHIHTAMAKTVGLPLGVAASLILKNEIRLTGLHVPVLPEIYEPVLKQLEPQGITFTEISR